MANGPGGTERASRCTLSINTSTTESWRAKPPIVGSGKVTNAGSVAKLVTYCNPPKRTGASPPARGDAVAQAGGEAPVRHVAAEGAVEPDHLGVGGQILQQQAREEGVAGVEPAQLGQAADALVEFVAGLVDQVVVEETSGPRHRPQPFDRPRLGHER